MAPRRKFDMAEEAALLPNVVADTVLEEIDQCFPFGTEASRREMSDRLADRADRIYAANASFRQKLRRESGRETLYAFMRHWSSAEMHRNHPSVYRQLPDSFKVGHPLRCDRRP